MYFLRANYELLLFIFFIRFQSNLSTNTMNTTNGIVELPTPIKAKTTTNEMCKYFVVLFVSTTHNHQYRRYKQVYFTFESKVTISRAHTPRKRSDS